MIVGIVVGAGCVVFAALGLADYISTTTTGPTKPADSVLTSTARPSEKNPGPVTADYTVAKDQPRQIKIPKLTIDAYIGRVGVGVDGAMATPNNIYFAGWYVNSVTPGANGLSIINGHAGGRYEQGIFRHLGDLSAGDHFSVQMGDLSWRDFTVVSKAAYAVQDAGSALFHDDPSIARELHLITCDGVFDDHTQTYNQRMIVVARAE